MSSAQYIAAAVSTEAPYDAAMHDRLAKCGRLLHAVMGLETEVGELTDQLKKHIFYGRELDLTNLVEEAGDLFWYLGVLCSALDVSFEYVQQLNIAKLKKRYPQKFTHDAANNRDLEGERKILEGEGLSLTTPVPPILHKEIPYEQTEPSPMMKIAAGILQNEIMPRYPQHRSAKENLVVLFGEEVVRQQTVVFTNAFTSSMNRAPADEDTELFYSRWWKMESERESRPKAHVKPYGGK